MSGIGAISSEGEITEEPVCTVETFTGSSSSYQTLASWTVTTNKRGILTEVAFTRDTSGVAQYKLTIAGETQFEDFAPERDVALPLHGVRLEEGQVVLLQVKSDGATSITVNGSITGGEIS